jgi:hypothetical protein
MLWAAPPLSFRNAAIAQTTLQEVEQAARAVGRHNPSPRRQRLHERESFDALFVAHDAFFGSRCAQPVTLQTERMIGGTIEVGYARANPDGPCRQRVADPALCG